MSSPVLSKAVLVVGATGTGKSKLAIELATHFNGEIINSDKIQAYMGIDVISNKVTIEEARGIPHHLMSFLLPDEEFTAENFAQNAISICRSISQRGKLPIIAGGSNSWITALVCDEIFKSEFDFVCIWIDVAFPALRPFLFRRVDDMVKKGLIEEARELYDPFHRDYLRGSRRAIGVPEMHDYFKSKEVDDKTWERILTNGIQEIKNNTLNLSYRQREKIVKLSEKLGKECINLRQQMCSCKMYLNLHGRIGSCHQVSIS